MMVGLTVVLDAVQYGTTDRILLVVLVILVAILLMVSLFGGYLRRP